MKNTAKKVARTKAFEARQLSSLKAKSAKGTSGSYFIILLFIIAFVNIIDEVTSNLSVSVQSSFVTEFFVNRPFLGKMYTFEEGLSLHTSVSVISYVLGIITPFYKALADKLGRKPLFAISTLGMSLGLLIIYFSPNYLVFLLGYAVIGFFFGHDIQIIYILEEAPDKYRAAIYSVLKALGIFGVVCIPMLRNALMGNDPTLWRRIFMAPAIAGIIAALMVVVLAKDTKVFMSERIAYLSIPYEERQAIKKREKEEKKAQRNQSGVFNAVKYIFANRDTKSLIISHIVFDAGMPAIALFYESSMHIAGMSTAEITKAMFVQPIVYAALTFCSGFIADKFGRKKTIVAASIISITSFILFAVGINNLWNPYLIGAFCGFYQGCYWIGRDYMNIMMTEKVPTDIRASVVGAEGLLVIIGLVVGYVLASVLMLILPVYLTCLVVALPCVGVAAVLLGLRVRETKGANLDEIGLCE
ncbi:MAG: MFS transporter [Ruminococcaceae bacterium]|nr:MFS transporter [Oscillospiraceae bacterium]